MEIQGKVAALTGAGNGIGEALALRLAAAGAAGIVVSDRDGADAERVARAIQAVGGRAVALQVDAAAEDQVRSMVALATARFGPVDIMCCNAGIVDEGGVDAADALWARSWDVNVMGHVFAARAVLPSMLDRGAGYLLNTCSAAGLLTSPGAAPYAVTKHAAIAFAEWLAIEHGDQGIRVSVICPQAVRTRLLQASIDSGNHASKAFATASRMLEPDEVAQCAIDGIRSERFHILPHPEVKDYAQRKAQDIDRWLAGMRQFVARARALPGAGP